MIPRIAHVRHLHDYALELTFVDGFRGEVDLREHIVGRGGLLEPLEEIDYFKRVSIEPDFGTLVWPNDVDFCPETLREWAIVTTPAQ